MLFKAAVGVAGGAIIEVWLWQGAVAQAHGLSGLGRILVASVLPIVVLLNLGGIASQGLDRVHGPAKLVWLKVMSTWLIVSVVGLPWLWEWSGDYIVARRAFLGAGAGLSVVVVVHYCLLATRRPWLVRKGGDGWRWEYRALASWFVVVGGFLALRLA